MNKRTTSPRSFSDQEIIDMVLGFQSMMPEEAKRLLDRKVLRGFVLAGVLVIAIWTLLWFVFNMPSERSVVWVFSGAVTALLAAFAVGKYIERRYTSRVKTEKTELWRHELIVMRAQSKLSNSTGGVFVLGFGKVGDTDSKAGYRYLYDSGINIELAEVPGKNTKIHLELDDQVTPYVVCWRERYYRECLLVDPPVKLPYEVEHEPRELHYDIYLPKDSSIGVFELASSL